MPVYETMDGIVKNAIIDIGDNTEHAYQRFLHWGLEGLRDHHFDTAREIKTVSLPMSDAKTIDLPLDYIDYVKVGVIMGDRVKTFIVNDKIELRHDVDSCGDVEAKATIDFLNGSEVSSSFFGGFFFGALNGSSSRGFGITCRNIGYCRVDRERQQIVFSSEVIKEDVYLEYITNGMNPSGESTVNPYAAKLIKLYILWMRKENSDKYRAGEKDRARSLYYNELRMVRARLSDFDISDFIEATRKGYLDRTGQAVFAEEDSEDVIEAIEECDDTFPVDDPATAPPGFKKIYWGSKANPLIDTSEEILTLESEFFEDRLITKTFNATGGNYLYFAYPVAFGTALDFIFNTFSTTFEQTIVTDFTDSYGTEDYYVYRSVQVQNGNSLTVEIQ